MDLNSLFIDCVVPKVLKFLGEGEVNLEESTWYEVKLEFPRRQGGVKRKTFVGGGSMDIFWDNPL